MNLLKNQFEENQSEQKRGVLIARLSSILFGVTFVYMILDLILVVHVQPFIYISFLICSAATFFLNYFQQRSLAKIVGLTFFNALIFMVASSEPFETGIHLHFFSAGAVAIVVYGFEEWKKGVSFISLSLLLCLTIFLFDFDFIGYREFTHEQSRIFFTFNIIIAAFISTYSFMLFSKINYDIEQSLLAAHHLMKDQNEKLEKVNKELDRFVYSASHDLRAPLSSLTGLITLAGMTTDISAIQEYHSHMQSRIVVMDKFIKEIIDYARNARGEVVKENINLKNLVNEVAESLKFVKDASRIVLDNKLDDSVEVQSDAYRLKVVFSNLISNAIKYHDLAKDKPYILISCDKNHGYHINVEDNGIGIPEEHQSKIFDMFYRAHDRSEGSGLGLYIVKETLTKIGGQISVASEHGKGSTFSITLPLA